MPYLIRNPSSITTLHNTHGNIKSGKFTLTTRPTTTHGATINTSGDRIQPPQETIHHDTTNEIQDNTLIYDDNTAQRKTEEEIKNYEGDKIDLLIENSKSWELKSTHAKNKYISKKRMKYGDSFVMLPANAHLLTTHLLNKLGSKPNVVMRADALSRMVASVVPGSTVLIADDTGGVLPLAVRERMGTTGRIYILHENNTPNNSYLHLANLDLQNVVWISWSDLRRKTDELPKPSPESENYTKEKQRYEASQQLRQFQNTLCDNLMITCSKFSPLSILRELAPRLALARPVAIYHQYRELLHPVFEYVQQSKQFLYFKLSEPWMREYQSLPGRIHPLMMMSSTAGYILTAITSSDEPSDDNISQGDIDESVGDRTITASADVIA